MTEKETGEPKVLPYGKVLRETPAAASMSLRDHFAAHALVALPDHLREMQTDHRIKIAEWCYGLADAMLAERAK